MAVDGIYVDVVAESGKNSASKHQPIRFSLSLENERGLMRDGTTKHVSRDQILRRKRVQGKNNIPLFS